MIHLTFHEITPGCCVRIDRKGPKAEAARPVAGRRWWSPAGAKKQLDSACFGEAELTRLAAGLDGRQARIYRLPIWG